MENILLRAADGAEATIYLHGAHVTSWRTPNGTEQLYLSERSDFRAGRAIRGGVPIIFPQFNQLGPLPRHGFARTIEWEFVGTGNTGELAQAVMRLADTATTRAIWDFSFNLEYHVIVGGDTLSVALNVHNPGEKSFSFTGALHTYFRVDDISSARIAGLRGTTFQDQTRGSAHFTQTADTLTIESETDRVYENAPDILVLQDSLRTLHIEKIGFPDVVVWNPFDKGKTLQDLTPGGERHFVCIEAAAVLRPIMLAPNERWIGTQILNVEQHHD